jgi:hypothetical protein
MVAIEESPSSPKAPVSVAHCRAVHGHGGVENQIVNLGNKEIVGRPGHSLLPTPPRPGGTRPVKNQNVCLARHTKMRAVEAVCYTPEPGQGIGKVLAAVKKRRVAAEEIGAPAVGKESDHYKAKS